MSADNQARRDATADAETLRLMDHETEDTYTNREPGAWGESISDVVDNPKSYQFLSRDGYRFAVRAARAAFRAVPGLRGE